MTLTSDLFLSSGLSAGSKGGMSVAGSTDNNMESLVDLHHKEMVSKKNDSMGE